MSTVATATRIRFSGEHNEEDEKPPGGTHPGVPRKQFRYSLGPPINGATRYSSGATQQFVSESGISGTVYLPMCSYTCGKNVEYREWNEATQDTHRRSREHASDRACESSYVHAALGADALRRACKCIITGNKTPRITAFIFVNGDLPKLGFARALTPCTPELAVNILNFRKHCTVVFTSLYARRKTNKHYIVRIKIVVSLDNTGSIMKLYDQIYI